jgi:hypothetical protein
MGDMHRETGTAKIILWLSVTQKSFKEKLSETVHASVAQ